MLPRFFWGLVLIGAGVMFLLDRIGLITIDLAAFFRTYWPVFIILAGFSGLLSSWRYGWGAGIWNLLVCGVGVIFLLHNLGVTGLSIGELFAYLGPVALIIFGVGLMFRPSSRSKYDAQQHRHPDRSYYEIYGEKPPAPGGGKWEDWTVKAGSSQAPDKMEEVNAKVGGFTDKAVWKAHKAAEKWERKRARHERRDRHRNHHYQDYADDYISTFAPGSGAQHKSGFIGDVFLGKDYWELKPMTISHFIGDTIIDLTKATIPSGETKLVVSTFIGDVKMLVPADVDVEIAVTASSFIGDMNVLDRHESGILRNLRTETPYYHESERKIRLIVSAFIGDVFVQKVG